jgi:hypothetical protein
MKQSKFLSDVFSPELAKLVINQFGGWSVFKDLASDVSRYGIDGGFCGFTYYSDTCKFAETPKVRRLIIEALESDADSMGVEVVEMVAGFGAFRQSGMDSDDKRDLYRFLSHTKCKDTTIPNLMAWYAAEAVCHAFDNS